MAGAVNLQITTMDSNVILDTSQEYPKAGKPLLCGFKYKLGPKCDENTQKLADAPNFGHTASLQVWSGWVSKPAKHYYWF